MARNAGGRQTKKGPVQVLVLDDCPLLWGNTGRVVALIAFEAGVLAFQDIPGLFVVEGLCIPFDQRKVCAIVLRVTAGALLTGPRGDVVGRMQALVSLKAAGDFSVA